MCVAVNPLGATELCTLKCLKWQILSLCVGYHNKKLKEKLRVSHLRIWSCGKHITGTQGQKYNSKDVTTSNRVSKSFSLKSLCGSQDNRPGPARSDFTSTQPRSPPAPAPTRALPPHPTPLSLPGTGRGAAAAWWALGRDWGVCMAWRPHPRVVTWES